MRKARAMVKRNARRLADLLAEAAQTCYVLFRILIPIMVVTRILEQLGLIHYVGLAVSPIMKLVGLPGSMGLVWATAMVTNLYGGIVVFAAIAPAESLSVAQVTVLGTMMLVAHSLPTELRIAQKAGPRFRIMAPVRVLGAIVLGLVLHQLFSRAGWLQSPNEALWVPPRQEPGWWPWALAQVKNLAKVFLVILALLFVLKVLRRLGVTDLLTRALSPVLRLLGMSREAAPVTIIGMTLGLSYGGGLIIKEARSGELDKRDVFLSLTLMGLCHSVIEDTLLMMLIGSHLAGILIGRVAFALLVTLLMVRLVRRIPQGWFERHFFRATAN